LRKLLWPLFARSARAQEANVVAGMPGEGADLALFASLAWTQPSTVVACKTIEDANEASILLVGVGPIRICRCVHEW
jgi:hypothetical protein